MNRLHPDFANGLREAALAAADSGAAAIVEGAEREMQRRRDEACLERVAMRHRLNRLRSKPNRWRLIARAVAKRRLANAEDYCAALASNQGDS